MALKCSSFFLALALLVSGCAHYPVMHRCRRPTLAQATVFKKRPPNEFR